MNRRRIAVPVLATTLMVLSVYVGAAQGATPKGVVRVGSSMSAEAVAELGGDWDPSSNACVAEALEQDYKGQVNLIRRPPANELLLTFTAAHLPEGAYRVNLDLDGGLPGQPRLFLSNFEVTPEDGGHVKFEASWPDGYWPPGNYTWGVLVNAIDPLCGPSATFWLVLKTDNDMSFILD